MPSRVVARSWVSPITAFSFLVVATTGVAMLLHWRLPGIKGLHQWVGLVFALAALLHVVLNWWPLLGCLRRRSAAVALGVTLVLSLAALLAPTGHDRPGGDRRRGNHGDSVAPERSRSR